MGKRNIIEPVYRITLTNGISSHVISNVAFFNKKQNLFLSCTIDIKKVPDQGLNTVNLKIYNLAQDGIPNIYGKASTETKKDFFVIVEFGYNVNDLRLVGQGKVLEAFSLQEGHNVVFNVEAFEGFGQLTSAVANFQLTPESTVGDLKQKLASRAGLTVVSDTAENNQFINKHYTVNTSNPYKEIKKLFPTHEVYVEGQKIYILNDNYIKTLKASPLKTIYEITEKTNALTIPRPEGAVVETDITLKPELNLNDTVSLNFEETYSKRFNGLYLVKGISHNVKVSYTDPKMPRSSLRLLKYQ